MNGLCINGLVNIKVGTFDSVRADGVGQGGEGVGTEVGIFNEDEENDALVAFGDIFAVVVGRLEGGDAGGTEEGAELQYVEAAYMSHLIGGTQIHRIS